MHGMTARIRADGQKIVASGNQLQQFRFSMFVEMSEMMVWIAKHQIRLEHFFNQFRHQIHSALSSDSSPNICGNVPPIGTGTQLSP